MPSEYHPHTEKPWRVRLCSDSGERVVFHGNDIVAIVRMPRGLRAHSECRANAALIARAPELRTALDELTRAAYSRENTSGDPCTLLAAQATLRAALRQADAVLRRTGGNPACECELCVSTVVEPS